MTGQNKFNRTYATYGPDVRDFEKDTDVSTVLTDILCAWSYPASALIGCQFSAQWLGDGERPENKPETLDLIFEMCGTGFLEIVVRGSGNSPQYGGWLVAGPVIDVRDEIANGYRVIVVTQADGTLIRHEFTPGFGYEPVPGLAAVPLVASRRVRARRAA